MQNSHMYPHCLPKKCRNYLDKLDKKKTKAPITTKKFAEDDVEVKQDIARCY